MIITQKKHWRNGYKTYSGKRFKTFALSLGSYAVMLCWGNSFAYPKNGQMDGRPALYFYKLI